MKHSLRCLLTFCLTSFCVVASSSNLAHAQAEPTPYLIPIFPKYKVLGVVYAPPGSASFVNYGGSTLVGTSHSMTAMNSSTNIVSTSSTTGFSLFGFGSTTTDTNSDGWTTTQEYTSSVAVQTANANSISTMGPISSALGVNHDNDIIYIWLNPVVVTQVSSYTAGSPPTIGLNWIGLSSNQCDLTDSASTSTLTFYQLASGCDVNQYPYPDIIGMPVWCLKNPYWPGQGCAQWLQYTSRSWDNSLWLDASSNPAPAGLTLQDYADILQADPFVTLNGSSINVCHPTYGPDLDPNDPETIAANAPLPVPLGYVNPTGNLPHSCGQTIGTALPMTRFQPYGTVEYPEPGPNGLPQTYSGSFTLSTTNLTGWTAIDSHTTSYSQNTTESYTQTFYVPIGDSAVPIGSFNIAMSNGTGNSQTWQQQNSVVNSATGTTTASYSITGPQSSDNYTGPATYNVYWDNVYGTYAFYSDLATKPALGNIGISASATSTVAFPSFGTVTASPIPTSGYGETAYLTNNSPYPLTMVWPTVTFNNPGFQIQNNILNDGSDHCSNQLLQPYGTAGLNGQGLPVYQCEVAIIFAPLLSDAPNNLNGTNYPINATLIAAGTENASSYQNILVTNQAAVSGTAAVGTTTQGATLYPTTILSPTEPNVYDFATSTGTAETETFTFTNRYSSSVTFAAYPNDITLTDGADFSVLNTGGTLDGCSGATLTAGKTCTFTLQFQPTTAAPPSGVFGTRITALGTVVTPPPGTLPGTNPLAFAAAAGMAVNPIVLSPTYLFSENGSLATLTITNNLSVTLSSITATLSNPSGFYWSEGTCSTGIAAGKSCQGSLEYGGSSDGSGILTITGTNGSSKYAATVSYGGLYFCPPKICELLTLTGAEQSKTATVPATFAKGSVTINPVIKPAGSKGTLSVTIGSFTATASYAAGASGDTAVQAMVAALSVKGSPVKAKASGLLITLTSVVAGSAGNLALETAGDSNFQIVASGPTLTGGKNATTTTKYDGGTVNMTTSGVTASATWSKGSTPQSIASALATSINNVAAAYWKASATGNVVSLTAVSPTPPSVGATVTDSEGFTPASFGASLTD